MNTIAKFFLTAKHWHLFLLLAVVPLIGEMIAMIYLPLGPRQLQDLTPTVFLFVGLMIIYMACFLAWFWSMGSFLNSIADPALKLRTAFFRFSLIYPVAYVPLFIAFFFGLIRRFVPVILPLHLFAMFCIFYDLYFVSRMLAQVETGKPASFYNYAGPFFLIWFYPVGVWIIQPRINRLYAERRALSS